MVEIKNSVNDVVMSSINFLSPFMRSQEEYNTFIRIRTSLSRSLDKRTMHPKKAALLKKFVIDNIILNSIWAISGIKNYNEFLKGLKKRKTGTITIKTRKQKDRSVIEIRDDGCGIKEEDLNKIFSKNYSTKKTNGLGLYLAKKVIKKLKGEIKAESKLGKFTKIIITV